MGVVRVEPEGLQSLAARCERLAVELAAPAAPGELGRSFQPSTTAVGTVNAAITTAVQTLTTRMSATAAKLSASATEYAARDRTNVGAIETVIFQ